MAKAHDTIEEAATLDQMAALNFEPWMHEEGEWSRPSNDEWIRIANPYLVTIRIAWRVMFKTKPELVKMMETLDDDNGGPALMDGFVDTINWFEGVLQILKSAEVRLLSAGAVVATREEGN